MLAFTLSRFSHSQFYLMLLVPSLSYTHANCLHACYDLYISCKCCKSRRKFWPYYKYDKYIRTHISAPTAQNRFANIIYRTLFQCILFSFSFFFFLPFPLISMLTVISLSDWSQISQTFKTFSMCMCVCIIYQMKHFATRHLLYGLKGSPSTVIALSLLPVNHLFASLFFSVSLLQFLCK